MNPVHVIKYQWENWEPLFYLLNGGALDKTKILNENFSITMGEKRCIGYFKNGKHFPCPHNKKIMYGYNCDECAKMDDYFSCIKCNGEYCLNHKQRKNCKENNYFIYLATFGPVIKVGISFEMRILKRLVEQGADFAAKIAFVKDGMVARRIESRISDFLNITDRVNGEEKYYNLFANPNDCMKRIIESIKKIKENSEIRRYLIKPEIFDLRQYYRLQNVASEPKKVKIKKGTIISGKAVAAKGNLVIFKENDKFFVVNAHEIVSRVINFN